MNVLGAWLALCMTVAVAGENWPAWRGPAGTGVSSEKDLPASWTVPDDVRWKAPLPGPGNSSPIVWGDRVFVTQSLRAENRRTVMCFERASGKLLWQSGVTYAEPEPTQQNNPYCSATPVTDGERVIASFGSAGLFCYDFAGKELWRRQFGKMNHVFGNASSPILYGDLCILQFGPDEKARLIAVDKRTGETAWEVDPPAVDPSEREARGGFAGPGGPPGFGPGGRGGFGPAMFLAPGMFEQADRDRDGKVTREELVGLAGSWFEKLDPEKTGKVNQERFAEKLSDLFPPPEGFGPPGGERPKEPTGGFNPLRFVAPGLFAALDSDKDGSLTEEELKKTLGEWFSSWDADKSGALGQEEMRDGLNAALPAPGGPAGPGGRRSRGAGESGPGAPSPRAERAPAEPRPSGPGDPRRPGEPFGPPGRGRPGPGGRMDPGGSWSTPIVIRAESRDELIVAFPYRLAAYDPKTGELLWFAKGLGGSIYTTPLFGEGIVVGMSSDMSGGIAIAVKPGGKGDVTASHRLWMLEDLGRDIGSGVIYDGRVYFAGRDLRVVCVDAKTGKELWTERLRGAERGRSESWCSLLLADGKIYFPTQTGTVFVLAAGEKPQVLAANAFGERTNASLAVSDGEFFLRTDSSLWCLRKKK